jgi:hypothetical protein
MPRGGRSHATAGFLRLPLCFPSASGEAVSLRNIRVSRLPRKGQRGKPVSRSNRHLSRAGLATLSLLANVHACVVRKVGTARHLGQSAPRIFRRSPPGDRLLVD